MQSSEHLVHIGFDPHLSSIILRYSNGDLKFRNCFLRWGAPSALGSTGARFCTVGKESLAHWTGTRNRLSFRAIGSAGYRSPDTTAARPPAPTVFDNPLWQCPAQRPKVLAVALKAQPEIP